jgi:hypothetical protein
MTTFATDELARSLIRALTTDGLLTVVADALNELHRRDGEVEIAKGSIETHHAEITGVPGKFSPIYWSDGGPEAAMASLTPSSQIDRAQTLVAQLSRKALDAPLSYADLEQLRSVLDGGAA